MARDENRDVRLEYRGTGFYVSLVVIFVAALTLLAMAVQNTGEVTVEILMFEFDLSLFAVTLAAGLAAVILVELIGVVWRRQRRIQLSGRAELKSLRAEPEGGEADPESEEPGEDLQKSDHPSVSIITGNARTGKADRLREPKPVKVRLEHGFHRRGAFVSLGSVVSLGLNHPGRILERARPRVIGLGRAWRTLCSGLGIRGVSHRGGQ